MRQTAAIFVDAYRELNSRKLFWLVLIISGLVVAACAMIGVDARGLTFLHWSLGFGPSTAFFSQETFYKQIMFVGLGIKFWLAALGTILALVSTASIFPDFISSGSVDLVLSKPMSRLRVFLLKYTTGLLFVAAQVSVFSIAVFLVIGLRAGSWEPRILLAIPLVVLFFSYLFAIAVLLGLITRSSIASLLLTLLIWGGVFLLASADYAVTAARAAVDQQSTRLTQVIQTREKKLAELRGTTTTGVANVVKQTYELPTTEAALARAREKLENARWWQKVLGRVGTGVYVVRTATPKLGETKDLLERALLSPEDRRQILDDTPDAEFVTTDDDDAPVDGGKISRQLAERKLTEPLWWIIGTSVGFEAVIVGIAAWIFCRRDF